jgi:hypothetical protein
MLSPHCPGTGGFFKKMIAFPVLSWIRLDHGAGDAEAGTIS